AEIRHASQRRWSFSAGPYETLVVGTQLSIHWNAEARSMEVFVTKGRVRVGGGAIQPQGLSVGAAQRLVADARGARVQAVLPKAMADAEPSRDRGVDAGRPDAPPVQKHASPRNTRPALDMSWKRLAKGGRHKEAMKAARRAGWGKLIARLKASDLLLLADAARLSRDAKGARQALLSARQRFRRKHTGRIAAYRLGRLAADQLRDQRQAAQWFHLFLREAPKSALAGDALAGEMVARQRLGDLQGARGLARRYLARYPKGAYAATAAKLSSSR
ncbi:MAG: hypothetical protein JRH20_32865, partial [Deltaproteobacteria bacterium]|nr:hypothetical protein [Deltaproteobacteria bacterium]